MIRTHLPDTSEKHVIDAGIISEKMLGMHRNIDTLVRDPFVYDESDLLI